MEDRIVIGGTVRLKHTIDGTPSLRRVINGHAGVFMPVYPNPYTGDVIVTPSEEQQVLSTQGLMMPTNVIVEPIPSNYGLITWVDGHIRVS